MSRCTSVLSPSFPFASVRVCVHRLECLEVHFDGRFVILLQRVHLAQLLDSNGTHRAQRHILSKQLRGTQP
jgi:hypothetical protein